MKKSKLTGALAVGGGLKQAIVPYIITGEENNGYSKGNILDANYVKQLINNAISNNISVLETPKITREDNPKVGQCVFDTTLGKPIWCKTAKTDTTAAIWVDATGATV